MIVYTTIFNNYDDLQPPAFPGDYFCLCDRKTYTPDSWRRIVIEPFCPSPRRQARYCKILSHQMFPNTDVTIFHSGNVRLTVPPQILVNLLGKSDIATPVHPERDCIYQEAEACITLYKDDHATIRKQMARYESEGYPRHNGLRSAFLVVRRHTPRIAAFNELWWSEVEEGSVRDQLSMDYALWKMGIEPVDIAGDFFHGPHYERRGHRKR